MIFTIQFINLKNHTKMKWNYTLLLAIFTLGFFAISPKAHCQENDNLYLEITKVKALTDDFLKMEQELVMPVIQERIKRGRHLFHGIMKRMYPNGENQEFDYLIVDGYSSFEHIHMEDPEVFDLINTTFINADLQKIYDRFNEAQDGYGSEIFILRDEAFPGPQSAPGSQANFIVMNNMLVEPSNTADYLKLESEVFKPIHQARGEKGLMADWLLLEKMIPYSETSSNTFVTLDMFTKWSDIAESNLGQLAAEVHPDMDLGMLSDKAMNARKLTSSEIYKFVDVVSAPAKEVTFEVINKGDGPAAKKGQEITFHGTAMDENGNVLLTSSEMGYPFHEIVGQNIYDRFFTKGITMVGKGGSIKMTVPVEYQDQQTKSLTNEKTGVFQIDILDIGEPKENGIKVLAKVLEEKGVEALKSKYSKLTSANSEYVLRESDLNIWGYQLMEKGEMEAAHFILEMNQKNNPKSWNACDSLGDYYLAVGNNSKAKECFENAIKIKPDFKASKDKLAALK